MSERDEVVAASAALRAPFPPEQIHQIPRKNKKTGTTVMLDYVGHADVTNRLLEVDPCWIWEPFAVDPDTGLPKIITRGQTAELWIRLTVAGMTRIGVGTCPTTKAEVSKELIGDAIRNAAMRLGVALDLWSKSDLDAEPEPELCTIEQVAQLVAVFDAVENEDARADLKRAWAAQWGRPADVAAASFDEAYASAMDLVEAETEDGER